MWGLQRSYGNFNLLFDLGIAYYFDDMGNNGVAPTFEVGIGYNLKSK